MSESNEEARALRVMIEAMRAEPPPALRWDEIEQKLMTTIERRDRARIGRSPSSGASSFGHVFMFAAAAAAIALGIGSMTKTSAMPQATLASQRVIDVRQSPASPQIDGARDLLSLHAGDVIEASDTEVRFGREGTLTWTLAPGGRVVVREMGDRGVGHTLVLERGVIHAEVTPRAPEEGMVEAFAVEVANTRVAVHGTAFSVEREGDRVLVDVAHGAVAIGPRSHAGITTGHLLIGPRRASFSLDGGKSARLLPPRASTPAVLAPIALHAAPVHQTPRPQAAPDHHVAPPDTPTALAALAAPTAPTARIAAVEPTQAAPAPEVPVLAPIAAPPVALLNVAGVRAQLDQCFNTVYRGGSPSVKVSLSADVSLVLEPDGRVQVVRFSPPLEPAFQRCAVSLIGRTFEAGGKTIKLPISFQK